tara:strand:- start:89 stop:346 length:258 start_codon:yes stop_codon:yes gene_type:complete
MLELRFSSQARRFLKKVDKTTWERLIKKIKSLQKEPFPQEVERVKGEKEKTFRVRVGSHRILYVIVTDINTLFISKIDKRPRAYN